MLDKTGSLLKYCMHATAQKTSHGQTSFNKGGGVQAETGTKADDSRCSKGDLLSLFHHSNT